MLSFVFIDRTNKNFKKKDEFKQKQFLFVMGEWEMFRLADFK